MWTSTYEAIYLYGRKWITIKLEDKDHEYEWFTFHDPLTDDLIAKGVDNVLLEAFINHEDTIYFEIQIDGNPCYLTETMLFLW